VVRVVVAVLVAARIASVALGLLGLWPNLRGDRLGDRREKAPKKLDAINFKVLRYSNFSEFAAGPFQGTPVKIADL
jgi:hypothetical protein